MPDSALELHDVLRSLGTAPRLLDLQLKEFDKISPDTLFKPIIKIIAEINKAEAPQKPPNSEKYLEQWRLFLDRKKPDLEMQAIRYLCWEAEAVNNPEFFKYITSRPIRITSRVIKGLVMTLHSSWHKDMPEKPIVKYTATLVRDFSGSDRTIAKWKNGLAMLLEKNGAAYFARDVLLDMRKDFKTVAESWALNVNSAYMRYAAYNAFDQSIERVGSDIHITKYILDIVIGWKVWQTQPDGFRKIISRLILHRNINSAAEDLRVKILAHQMLGDPRLPANRNKWLDIDPAAKQKFIGWLARRDIVFFFDHVLKGNDRHGRREFWLRYVNSMVSSRPLLSDATAIQFRNNRDICFGKLTSSSNQAAFILDFGEVLAVEFSDVGMIYIYKRAEFERNISDIWVGWHISENSLKDQRLPDECKIRHRALENIVNVDWRDNAASVLASYGVRR